MSVPAGCERWLPSASRTSPTAVTALANIALSTFLSHRSDLLGSRRSMLLLGSACGALGYLGYAFTRDVWLLMLIGAFVLGVASMTFSQLLAHARELLEGTEIPKHEAPLYMHSFRMCFALLDFGRKQPGTRQSTLLLPCSRYASLTKAA